MARKMDRYAKDIANIRSAKDQISELNKRVNMLKKLIAADETKILKAMGNSTEGTIDGKKVITVADQSRRSVTIDRVMEYAPEAASKIIAVNVTRKVSII